MTCPPSLPDSRHLLGTAVLALALLPSVAQAQGAAPLAEATAQQLVGLLTQDSGPVARSFTRGSVPDAASSRCGPAQPQATGAGSASRTLVVEYAGDAAPGVQLGIQFERGSDVLDPREQRLLDNLAQALSDPRLAETRFAVAGHTDVSGAVTLNFELSCARALSAMKYLVRRGIAADRMTAYGFGSKRLLPGMHAEAKQHRRVEIRLEH